MFFGDFHDFQEFSRFFANFEIFHDFQEIWGFSRNSRRVTMLCRQVSPFSGDKQELPGAFSVHAGAFRDAVQVFAMPQERLETAGTMWNQLWAFFIKICFPVIFEISTKIDQFV